VLLAAAVAARLRGAWRAFHRAVLLGFVLHMLGLDESGHCELLRSMADNFAYLIDTYGHVPNGNRSYYLSRSQPPVFALMTDLFEDTGVHRATDYLPQLRKEYAFWSEGGE